MLIQFWHTTAYIVEWCVPTDYIGCIKKGPPSFILKCDNRFGVFRIRKSFKWNMLWSILVMAKDKQCTTLLHRIIIILNYNLFRTTLNLTQFFFLLFISISTVTLFEWHKKACTHTQLKMTSVSFIILRLTVCCSIPIIWHNFRFFFSLFYSSSSLAHSFSLFDYVIIL